MSRTPQQEKSRELLVEFTRQGALVEHVKKSVGHFGPAKGKRGLKRRAKKLRHARNARRLQTISWRVTTLLDKED